MSRGLNIVFWQNCGIKMMFLMKKRRVGVLNVAQHHPETARLTSPREFNNVCDRCAFLSVHLIDWKQSSILIGQKSDLIQWISTGGIYDFPALVSCVQFSHPTHGPSLYLWTIIYILPSSVHIFINWPLLLFHVKEN